MNKIFLQQIKRFTIVIGSCILLFLFMKYTYAYLYPFLIAYIVSYLLNPLITRLENRFKIKRNVLTIFVICTFSVIFFIASYFFFKRLLLEFEEITAYIPHYIEQSIKLATQFGQVYFFPFYEKIREIPIIQLPDIETLLTYITHKLNEYLGVIIKQVIVMLSGMFTSFTYFISVFVVTMIATYFMIKDNEKIQHLFNRFIPKKFFSYSRHMNVHMKKSLFGLLKAQLNLALITALLSFFGFIFLQIGHALTLTIAIFILDLIPYVGVGLVFIPWIIFQFFSENYVFTIQLIVLYGLIILIRQFIEPKLIAKSIGVHPLVSLFVLFSTVQMFGFVGFVLIPFILIILSSLFHSKTLHRLFDYIRYG